MSFGPACERCGCNSYDGAMDHLPRVCPFCRRRKYRGWRDELCEALRRAQLAIAMATGFIVGGGVRTAIFQRKTQRTTFVLSLSYEGERWQVPNTSLDGAMVHHVALDGTWKF